MTQNQYNFTDEKCLEEDLETAVAMLVTAVSTARATPTRPTTTGRTSTPILDLKAPDPASTTTLEKATGSTQGIMLYNKNVQFFLFF